MSEKININLTNADDIQNLIKKISNIDNNITIGEIKRINEDEKTFYSIDYTAHHNNGNKINKRLNIEIDTSEYDILKDYKIYFLIFFFIALTITIASLFPFSNIALVILPVSISMAVSFVKYYLPLIMKYYIDNITIEKRIDIDMKDENQLKEFLSQKFLSLLNEENSANIKNGKLTLEIENLDKEKSKKQIKENIIATSLTISALCDVVLNPIGLLYNLYYYYIPSYLEEKKKINEKYKDQANESEENENNIKTNTNTQMKTVLNLNTNSQALIKRITDMEASMKKLEKRINKENNNI